MCFTTFVARGYLPDAVITVILMLVVKDRAANISSRDNYRPIALASTVNKVEEKLLVGRLNDHLTTAPNQFGFKKRRGSDICYQGSDRRLESVKWEHVFVLPGRQQRF